MPGSPLAGMVNVSALLVGTALVFAIGVEDEGVPALEAVPVGVMSVAGELLAAVLFAEDVLVLEVPLSEVPPATEAVSFSVPRLKMLRA